MKATRKFKDYALKHAKIRKDKKVKGFTLVELIIVIAIIGILAAILIPTMTGKVKDSKLKTANDGAAKLAEQAAIIITENEANGVALAKGVYTSDVPSSDTTSDYAKFKAALENVMPSLKNTVWGININSSGSVESTVYAKTSSDVYIGKYPNATDEPSSSGGLGTSSSGIVAQLP